MFPPPPARSQYSVLIRVTELVEPVLVLQPVLVSRVDLPGLAASSKQQAASSSTREMGKKSELRRGALDLVEFLVDDTYGCEVQSHKV